MSTTDAEPFLPFPICHPLPLIGSNEKVVPGPATGAATNENPNAISDFGLCRYRGIFANSPVHSAAKDECLTIPGQKWGSIFNDNAPAPGCAQDSPGRSACYSRLGLPLPDGEGNDLHALEALAKEVQWEIQKVKDFEDVVVVWAGYVRATNSKRQHWHRDRPLTHKIKGRGLSVFVPCNVDIPADASCGRYVPLSHEGVPKPWFECPMDMEVGDMTVFTSELIHTGGAVPVGLPAGTPRIIAFIALANYNVLYNNTVPISPPPWAYAESEVQDSVKCGHSHCRKKVAQPPSVCFMCPKVPLCPNHASGTCSVCDATLTAPTPELFQARPPDSPLRGLSQGSAGSAASVGDASVCSFAATCLMPLGNTVLLTQHLPHPPEPITSQQPVDVEATPCLPEKCPFGPHTHEEERLPQPSACYPLLRTHPGTILVIRSGRFGGTAYCGDPDGDELRVLRWDQVPLETPNVVDPMIIVQAGLVVENPKEAGEYWCACQQVANHYYRLLLRLPVLCRFENEICPTFAAGRGAGRGFQRWKGVPALEGGVPALEGGGGGVPPLKGRGSSGGRGFQRGFHQGFQRWKRVLAVGYRGSSGAFHPPSQLTILPLCLRPHCTSGHR